jgi:hypothetical protein
MDKNGQWPEPIADARAERKPERKSEMTLERKPQKYRR